jgi:hypothetical protein
MRLAAVRTNNFVSTRSEFLVWTYNDDPEANDHYGVAILTESELVVGTASQEQVEFYTAIYRSGLIDSLLLTDEHLGSFDTFNRHHIDAIGAVANVNKLRIEINGEAQNISHFASIAQLNQVLLKLSAAVLPGARACEEDLPVLGTGLSFRMINPMIWATLLGVGIVFLLDKVVKQFVSLNPTMPLAELLHRFPNWTSFALAVFLIVVATAMVVRKTNKSVKILIFR